MDKVDVSDVAFTGVDNFKIFFKFLTENGLLEKSAEYLKSIGIEEVAVSKIVIDELKSFIKSEYQKKQSGITRDADMVIECNCCRPTSC